MEFTAAVLTGQQQPLSIERLYWQDSILDVGQVLVRILRSGICGAQLNEIAGVKGPDKFLPHLLGHEGCGEVEEIGPGVSRVKPGDRVVMHWRPAPGIAARPASFRRPNGDRVGAGAVTTFSEWSIVSENRLTPISSDVPAEIGALMGCAVTTGLGLVAREARIQIGESVLVFGCGGVGLNVIQGARLVSAHPITVVDKVGDKVHAGLAAGGDFGVAANQENDLRWLLRNTPKADVVIDTTGNKEVIEFAWEMTAPKGRLFLVAQVRHDVTISLQTLAMHTGKTFSASDGGGTDPAVDIPRYVALYQAGKLELKSLITHRAPLAEINSVLDAIRRGEVGRAILEMGDE